MSEPLPDLPPLERTPSAWQVCPFCGAVIAEPVSHKNWHQGVVNRVRGTEDTIATVRAKIARDLATDVDLAAQTARINQLAARVAALDNGGTV